MAFHFHFFWLACFLVAGDLFNEGVRFGMANGQKDGLSKKDSVWVGLALGVVMAGSIGILYGIIVLVAGKGIL